MSDHATHDFKKQLLTYQGVLAALLVLTGVTWGIAYIDMGGTANTIVALGIATVKALLVILLFMHVKDSSRLVKLTVAAGGFWLLILFSLLIMDFAARKGGWAEHQLGGGWF